MSKRYERSLTRVAAEYARITGGRVMSRQAIARIIERAEQKLRDGLRGDPYIRDYLTTTIARKRRRAHEQEYSAACD